MKIGKNLKKFFEKIWKKIWKKIKIISLTINNQENSY